MSVENQAKMELTNMNQINGYYKCKQVGINKENAQTRKEVFKKVK